MISVSFNLIAPLNKGRHLVAGGGDCRMRLAGYHGPALVFATGQETVEKIEFPMLKDAVRGTTGAVRTQPINRTEALLPARCLK